MPGLVNKLLIGASLVAGVSVLATTSAEAFSITGSDYLLYCSNGVNTFTGASCTDSLDTILTGNSTAPGGNVELFASSEGLSNAQFMAHTGVTSLTGQVGGQDITISSLTYTDWMSDVGGVTLLNKWFGEALTNTGIGNLLPGLGLTAQQAQNVFVATGGLQRFSDANISYVNPGANGAAEIGLAGHYDALALIMGSLTPQQQMMINWAKQQGLIGNIQASELVKVTYGGATNYFYNFSATPSGQFELGDGTSHNGNYALLVPGGPAASVPEPSAMLGLMAVGGMFAARKRKSTDQI